MIRTAVAGWVWKHVRSSARMNLCKSTRYPRHSNSRFISIEGRPSFEPRHSSQRIFKAPGQLRLAVVLRRAADGADFDRLLAARQKITLPAMVRNGVAVTTEDVGN